MKKITLLLILIIASVSGCNYHEPIKKSMEIIIEEDKRIQEQEREAEKRKEEQIKKEQEKQREVEKREQERLREEQKKK